MNTEETYQAIILGIRDYFKKNSFEKAVIGLSGGLDSTVSAYLIVKALTNKNVTAILMPDIGVTKDENINDAIDVAKKLKIKYLVVPINSGIEFFKGINKKANLKIDIYSIANVKARIRMVILYYFANILNALVIGTSDKSEIALGYTTKYGDNASDILVIGDLWKTDVIKLGKYLKVPKKILNKKPSAELILNLDAEKELGADYKLLDKILRLYIEEDLSMQEIIERLSFHQSVTEGKTNLEKMLGVNSEHFDKGFDKKIVANVLKRLRTNEHKRRSPMIIRLSDRSFHGMEWRMPITNKYEEG